MMFSQEIGGAFVGGRNERIDLQDECRPGGPAGGGPRAAVPSASRIRGGELSICHICERDGGGGAMRAASRLHSSLLSEGFASSLYVASKTTNDPNCHQIAPPQSFLDKMHVRWTNRRNDRSLSKYASSRSTTLEIFTQGRGALGKALVDALPKADVYTLHWSNGLIDYPLLFRRLGRQSPVVWRMPDMNPMTGGCHYALGCDRYTASCGRCPQLGSKDDDDLSREVYTRKRRALAHLDPAIVRFVAPSVWLQREARRSSLLSRFDILTIPTGVDCETFRPRSRAVAREVFGLPPDDMVILFASDSVSNHRKGFDLLRAALRDPAGQRPLTLAALGAGTHETSGAYRCVSLGHIEDPRLLSFAYSAADVFVLPTRADNLPNTVLEAMACGVPVVSFDVGGVPDAVRPGRTGLLAPAEDVRQLRGAIITLLQDQDLRASLSAACREVAVREYSRELQARRYAALYDELISIAAAKRKTTLLGL